jgi:hypothetical protein
VDRDELTEYALRREDGTMVIRTPGPTEALYPAEHWARDQRALGQRVFRRRVIVVEDWAELEASG